MSSIEAKLSQTFQSLNIAGKRLGSNYKVCLGSVFHEKHVFEVCFCLQRFESLQKVECLALARENTISAKSLMMRAPHPFVSEHSGLWDFFCHAKPSLTAFITKLVGVAGRGLVTRLPPSSWLEMGTRQAVIDPLKQRLFEIVTNLSVVKCFTWVLCSFRQQSSSRTVTCVVFLSVPPVLAVFLCSESVFG